MLADGCLCLVVGSCIGCWMFIQMICFGFGWIFRIWLSVFDFVGGVVFFLFNPARFVRGDLPRRNVYHFVDVQY